MKIRLLLVQYGGDYRETVKRFARGEDETYYAQKYSVNAVAEWSKRLDAVSTLCCITDEPYDEMLDNGVRAIGAGFSRKIHVKNLIRLIEKYEPTHLIIRTPIREVLEWAIQKQVKIMATLADSFNSKRWIDKVRNHQLAKLLNSKQVDWVGNHGLYSSLSLARIGVSTNKIVPYDFPHSVTPELFSVKLLLEGKAVWNIVYVGAIMESKGVGDTLRSVSILKSRGTSCLLKIVGKGEVEAFINIAKSLDIEDSVVFLGLLPNKEVIPLMREADIVLIPSRHEYPEGFPFTIYEALCSRTPIIASDHPMFINKLIHETNALIFSAGNAESLASSIERLISSSELYNRISSKSHEAWCSLQIPVMWSDFINAWLSASPKDRQWLSEHCLSSSRYF